MSDHFFRIGEEVRSEPYHYKACGLDGIYLLNGYDVKKHEGERHVFVRNVDELHMAIGRHIVSKRKGLTGKDVKFLRNTLDLTQSALAGRLGNNPQSIARWEKGQCEIPGDAEKLLRIIFFACLATDEELELLRDLILETLEELDLVDESAMTATQFQLDDHWKEAINTNP